MKLLHSLKAPGHALPDGDAGDHDDELAPAVPPVQLEHGLDIDVGFPRARLHLHVQGAGPQGGGEGGRLVEVLPRLHPVEVGQQLGLVQREDGVGVPQSVRLVQQRVMLQALLDRQIPAVRPAGPIGLSGKHIHHALHRLGLVGLDGIFQLHIRHHSTFLTVLGL